MIKRLPIPIFSLFGILALVCLYPALYAQMPVQALDDSTTSPAIVAVGFDTLQIRSASGSLAALASNQFNQGINNHPLATIQGKLAGLFIASVHGNPNGLLNVYMRGKNSLFNSNSPLYVVDGVPGVSIDQIAVEDIEQITLLKEPSQAGIYGNQAGNGVLLITTKRGKYGKAQVDYHGYTGVAYAAGQPSVLNADEYRAAVIKYNQQDRFQDMGANTDWFREVTRTALAHNHQLSVGSGFGTTTYRLSGGYFNQQGVVKKTDLQRLNARLNVDTRLLADKLLLSASLSVMSTERNDLPHLLFRNVTSTLPTNPVYNPDGSFFTGSQSQAPGSYQNPAAQVAWNQNQSQQRDLIGLLRAQYLILPGLSIGAGYSLNSLVSENRRIYNNYLIDHFDYTYKKYKRDQRWLNLSTKYSHQWEEHSFGIRFDYLNQFLKVQESATSMVVQSGNAPGAPSAYSSYAERISNSFVTHLDYSWSNRGFLHINLARYQLFDFTTKYIFLPSASLAWDWSEGAGWNEDDVLNQLKWRINWGKTTTTALPFNPFFFGGGSSFSWLTWPTVESYGTGIDFQLFGSRVTGSLDGYSRISNQENIYPYETDPNPHPFSLKYTIRNQGLELMLHTAFISQPKFEWQASFAGSWNQSKVLEGYSVNIPLSYVNGVPISVTHKDASTGFISVQEVDKIVNGVPTYKKTPDGLPQLKSFGNIDPSLTTSLTNTFILGRIDLHLTFVGVFGNSVYQYQRNALAHSAAVPNYNISAEAFQFSPFSTLPPSSLFVENSSFVRLDNFSLGYTLGREGKIFRKARVYLAGRNLFTLTSYRGVDPQEGNLGVSDFDFFYPASRSFNLGLNVSF